MATSVLAGSPDPDSFQVRTTGDLAALCSAKPGSENYVAAIHFCHGFGSGAFQYYQSVVAATPKAKFVCAPDPPPTRSEAMAGFVEWARAHPETAKDKPLDSLFRYLAQKYPCT